MSQYASVTGRRKMQQPGVSAQQFNQDANAVERDLTTLKTLLEQP